jgi:hypothetical protein
LSRVLCVGVVAGEAATDGVDAVVVGPQQAIECVAVTGLRGRDEFAVVPRVDTRRHYGRPGSKVAPLASRHAPAAVGPWRSRLEAFRP